MPVSAGYVVGPGDEIVVRMWGRVEGTQRMVVDRDGKIFFPKFGSLYVAGKTFEEVKAFLKSKVSTIAEVSSDVGMGQMKGIRVSVMGEVRFPGWYNVSSLHTAIQALSTAGGVKDIGSLRRIRIRRGGSTCWRRSTCTTSSSRGTPARTSACSRGTSSSSRWWGSSRPSRARCAAPPSTN